MPAKKKQKKVRRASAPSLKQQINDLANVLMRDDRLSVFITDGGACEIAARALVALADEREDAEMKRRHWCEVAIAREQRAELAEDALRALLEASQRSRPSVPLVIAQAPQISGMPHPTLGEPGDPGRYSREVRP